MTPDPSLGPEPIEPAARWYLVQTRPRQADRAEANLALQGYSVFHPRVVVEGIRRGRRVPREESLFPNYLFIHLRRWVDNWYPLRSTRGVARLVSFGDEPLPVADTLIDEIHRRLEGQPIRPTFEPGEAIEIVEGPLRGLDAIFQCHKGADRVLLLIDMLHRQVTLTLPVANVRRA
ncbi:transcription/translation regulatory transformer protein RfaH [Thiococcus pfennigii]|jgi:transcriptional antiterminator RfaH|uniref:transcription/translation regulatory transformer protein RfaH n=1 Tax=Thiococcus pfennigii TaxID=1057 RepID=UPI001906E35A|nr:transcription/translation regulatory transformer protein RfaH [Thiococcus pfennigii]MBK1699548.1 transcription/translation regulatory transformer protein RfaH [Thiococcus pfennigii]MBK1731473.1 transcription/translation regulatory transformer protein RfaH [Thiococcus pfennigii]